MREDIVAGLRNAIERGQNINEAVQSFINAGYNPSDVKEAAEYISQGATHLLSTPEEIRSQFPKKPQLTQQTSGPPSQPISQPSMQQTPRPPSQPISQPSMQQTPPVPLAPLPQNLETSIQGLPTRGQLRRISQRKKLNSNLTLIIILSVILLLLLGLLIYVIFFGKKFISSLFG